MIAVFEVTAITPNPGRSFPHWLASMAPRALELIFQISRIVPSNVMAQFLSKK